MGEYCLKTTSVILLTTDKIPMIAPFLGCAFGEFLYDVFIYTGPSPVNSPWLGLKQLMPENAMWTRREHLRREKQEGVV